MGLYVVANNYCQEAILLNDQRCGKAYRLPTYVEWFAIIMGLEMA